MGGYKSQFYKKFNKLLNQYWPLTVVLLVILFSLSLDNKQMRQVSQIGLSTPQLTSFEAAPDSAILPPRNRQMLEDLVYGLDNRTATRQTATDKPLHR